MSRFLYVFALIGLVGCGGPQPHTLGSVDTSMVTTDATSADVASGARKVIFTATVKLIVPELAKLEEQLASLVKEHDGYMAQVSVDRAQGQNVNGRWTARVPVRRYDDFLRAIVRLGIPETFDQQSQDVTEEFVDLNSRIANERRLEERIVELLKNPSGEIDQVIAVERELARVRGEIEKMEGRLRYLSDRTEYTTVTIVGLERKAYVPPQTPTFIARIVEAWSESVASLRKCAEDLVIVLAALLPWLMSGFAVIVLIFVGLRLFRPQKVHPVETDTAGFAATID